MTAPRPTARRSRTPHQRAAADRDGGIGRRRQVDADRPAAVRLQAILEDQLEHVVETSERRGDGYVNLALLTDGLRAEREQGITIDVAYRYFQTPRRKFIIADTPGHEQYTRNMVTGASTADLSIVLVDARKGVSEQTRRHAHIASLLRIPHLVVCVNKMDLVDYDEDVFDRIAEEMTDWAARLDIWDITFIPISALHGDNVVDRSTSMDWYGGPSLLYHLEHVVIATDRNLADVRFPVQWVIRPMSEEHHDYRGYAGQVAAGVIRPGDEVLVLPSGKRTRIASVDSFEGPIDAAFPTMSVALRLEDEIDISRGDMFVNADDPPVPARELEAMVCWMSERPLTPGARYAIKHTTRTGRAVVDQLEYRVDVNTLDHVETTELAAERDRTRPPAVEHADDGRPLPPQPHDRQLHPDRRDDQRHGRRRDARHATSA